MDTSVVLDLVEGEEDCRQELARLLAVGIDEPVRPVVSWLVSFEAFLWDRYQTIAHARTTFASFLEAPETVCVPMDSSVWLGAAELVRSGWSPRPGERTWKHADAVHYAASKAGGCDEIWTCDEKWQTRPGYPRVRAFVKGTGRPCGPGRP